MPVLILLHNFRSLTFLSNTVLDGLYNIQTFPAKQAVVIYCVAMVTFLLLWAPGCCNSLPLFVQQTLHRSFSFQEVQVCIYKIKTGERTESEHIYATHS